MLERNIRASSWTEFVWFEVIFSQEVIWDSTASVSLIAVASFFADWMPICCVQKKQHFSTVFRDKSGDLKCSPFELFQQLQCVITQFTSKCTESNTESRWPTRWCDWGLNNSVWAPLIFLQRHFKHNSCAEKRPRFFPLTRAETNLIESDGSIKRTSFLRPCTSVEESW